MTSNSGEIDTEMYRLEEPTEVEKVTKVAQKPVKNQSLFGNGGGVSRYVQLATLFRRNISAGTWKVGNQIPTIDVLASSHGVATATVRQALSILASEKLIDRFRAKGTFVIRHPDEKLWCNLRSDWEGLMRTRQGAQIETLSEKKGRKPPSIKEFDGKVSIAYRHVRRRHWRDGEAFLLSDIYIEESLYKRIPPDMLSTHSSLQCLMSIQGVRIKDVRQTVTMGTADLQTAETLNLEMNAPVAFMRGYAIDPDNRLVVCGESIYRGDVFSLSLRINPEQDERGLEMLAVSPDKAL